jgi:hypothetical protein
MIEHNVVVVGGVEYKAEDAGNRGCSQCDIAEHFIGNLGNCHVDCSPRPEKGIRQYDFIFKLQTKAFVDEMPIKVIEL